MGVVVGVSGSVANAVGGMLVTVADIGMKTVSGMQVAGVRAYKSNGLTPGK